MANPEHLAILKQGGEVWKPFAEIQRTAEYRGKLIDLRDADLKGSVLSELRIPKVDLSGANLCEATLDGTRFFESNFRGASLDGASLGRNILSNCNMAGAVLCGLNAEGTQLRGVDLSNADLSEAFLFGTLFHRCDARHSNFARATLDETIFADIDLRDARGLDHLFYVSPSILGHRTLERSGRLPLAFLRGCGLSDTMIDYLPSLYQSSAIQFYSCFISYSTANQDFADTLHADLQNKGVRCWFAPHDMQPGRKIHDQIDEAIRVYDRLLLILSNESMSSPWVKVEINKARKKERQQNRSVLFPIRLVPFSDVRAWEQFNADLGEDIAQEIREYHIQDFSTWKTDHDSYTKSFDALLKALKSADAPTAGAL